MSTVGTGHEHISKIRWQQDETKDTGESDVAAMVIFIEENGDESVYCPDTTGRGSSAWVLVRENAAGTKYIQTKADGKFTNNLLALPEF